MVQYKVGRSEDNEAQRRSCGMEILVGKEKKFFECAFLFFLTLSTRCMSVLTKTTQNIPNQNRNCADRGGAQ